ncbi:MAG: CrcB family protein [Myxococcota bacterium]
MTPAPWVQWLAIAGGGALGALSRYGVSLLLARWLGPAFPFGTLAVNGVGSFVLGLVVALGPLAPGDDDLLGPTARALAGTGFCGAFTTFSTFSVETMRMPPGLAATNVGANLALSLVAASTGLALGRSLSAGLGGS